jgi:hypothetical protein
MLEKVLGWGCLTNAMEQVFWNSHERCMKGMQDERKKDFFLYYTLWAPGAVAPQGQAWGSLELPSCVFAASPPTKMTHRVSQHKVDLFTTLQPAAPPVSSQTLLKLLDFPRWPRIQRPWLCLWLDFVPCLWSLVQVWIPETVFCRQPCQSPQRPGRLNVKYPVAVTNWGVSSSGNVDSFADSVVLMPGGHYRVTLASDSSVYSTDAPKTDRNIKKLRE